MRNLKKVMALALATVMLFGMMVMGAGAADYKDADQIDTAKFGTAVDLLNAIGAFQGNADGTLNPKGTLTRAEAAVSIAKLALTKDIAAKLNAAADTGFADVDAGYAWASGAIAYAKQLGIVSGVTADKYDPAGTLTGYAYAKMLLVVLGYNADTEGYKGDNWESNINLDAIQAGLLNGLSINLGEAILREQAIQMAANALVATCVEYKTAGSTITLPGGIVINNGGSAATPVAGTVDYTPEDANDNVQQLIEKLYPTFKLVSDTDSLGFAEQVWLNNGTEVASKANAAELKAYANAGAVKGGDLYVDAGYVKTTAKVYVNSLDTAPIATAILEKDNKGTPAKVAGSYDYTGATMKLIKNGAEYVVLVEVPTMTKITKVNAATASAGATAEIVVGGETLKIETEAYKVGDQVIVTLGKNDADKTVVLTHKAPFVVTGAITETAKDGVYVDGVKYPVAGADAQLGTVTNVATPGATKYNFVVENGYIVADSTVAGTATKASLDKVFYLADYTDVAKDAWGVETKYAQLVSMVDGAVSLVKVAPTASNTLGELYTVADVKDKDYKELKDFTGMSKDAAGKETQTIFETALAEADKKFVVADKAIATAAGKAYITAKTAILNVTGSDATLAAKYVAAPFDVALTDAQATSKVIYTKTATGALEAEVVIVVGKITANTVAAAKNAYYVLEGDLGSVYNADAKAVYTKVKVIDLKTLETFETLAAKAVVGYAEGTVNKYGAYEFTAKVPTTVKEVAKNGATLYGTYLTAAGLEDLDASAVKVLNPYGVKYNNAAIATLTDLVKSGEEFTMNVSYNALLAPVGVTYIIINK